MKPQRRSEKALGFGDPIKLKAADSETGILAGDTSQFWVVDSYGEFTIPGCFAESIRDRGPDGADRIVLRYEHYKTCGKATKLAETDTGLYAEAFVKDDGAEGSTLRSHLSEPYPITYGLSIGFYRQETRPATDSDPLILDFAPEWVKRMIAAEGGVGFLVGHTKTKLVEFSAVTFPAVDNATVTDYRSDMRASVISSLLSDLKAGRLSDDEVVALKDLTDAWLADVGTGKGETPDSTPEPRTAVRDYRPQIALLEAQARLWGIPTDGAHAA